MYQWRKFDFFEENKTKIPDEIDGQIQCCSSGRGRIVLGSNLGSVSLLDRGLQLHSSFPAHSFVLFLQQLKQRNFLVTVGEDEQMPPQKAAVCLKVFDLDKRQEEGSSASAPECVQILRIFTNQFPEAKITSFAVFEDVDSRTGKNTFYVNDLKNRLIAHSIAVQEVSHMLCEWGNILLIMADKSALLVVEKDMESKLDMLFKKNLYPVAINLVQSQQADAAATAEVLRKYGDHLYSKQNYDEAMAQYIHTIGHLEPSYVIQKFLDAQRIYNLTNYLEKLHENGLASKDHITRLLNCYTKLKDVEKLNIFIKIEDGVGEHKFDVETAIKVCRALNYHEHAMYVAKKAGRHEWYLKILLEDLDRYDEALQYINSLEPIQAGVTVKEYGKILMEHKPKDTVQILMRLCTEDGEPATGSSSNGTFLSILPSPVDFINIFLINHNHLWNSWKNTPTK